MAGVIPGNANMYNSAGELCVYTNERVETFTDSYVGAEANTTILTPAAGKKLEITGVYVSTEDKLTDVTLDFAGGDLVFVLHTTNQQTSSSVATHIKGADDEALRITCGAGTFVSITYYED